MSAKVKATKIISKNIKNHSVHFKNLSNRKRICANLAGEIMDVKHDILQPSGYDEGPVSSVSELFADKKPIETTGTTCDAFSARFENLRVFVKQLKPEFLSNPKFREAFRKEYEIGFSLSHSSLPRYIRFLNGDTIVSEFVDGITLHDLILTNDTWIHQNANIKKAVGQLLDVVDYLHRKNVIHCDIKTDNLMITNETRNLMLIDFDKAFSASQDLTPGTPLNYGTEDENLTKRQMDIRGVRNIIEKLSKYVDSWSLKERMEKLVSATGAPEVTMPELLEIWKQPLNSPTDEKSKSKRHYFGWGIGGIVIVALFVVVWSYFPKESREVMQPDDRNEVENPVIPLPDEKKEETRIQNMEERQEIRLPVSPDWNSLLETDIAPMNKFLDGISSEIATDKISPDSVAEIVIGISDEMNTFNSEVVEKYASRYPELSQDKILTGIYDSSPVKTMVKRRDEILQRLLEIQQQENNLPQ